MTSPTVSVASTERTRGSLEGSTAAATDAAGTGTGGADGHTTLPDHENIHSGTVDSTPARETTVTDCKSVYTQFYNDNLQLFFGKAVRTDSQSNYFFRI